MKPELEEQLLLAEPGDPIFAVWGDELAGAGDPRGALVSLLGLQFLCGYERGSQRLIPNHGATDSSNQWVTSCPGWPTVGLAA